MKINNDASNIFSFGTINDCNEINLLNAKSTNKLAIIALKFSKLFDNNSRKLKKNRIVKVLFFVNSSALTCALNCNIKKPLKLIS